MTVYKLYLSDLGRGVLRIGKQGENNATEFIFDISIWLADWPEGTVTAALRTPDGIVRETSVTQQGNLVEWPITSSETALSGNGVLELSLQDSSGVVVKSVSAVTAVASSITSASGELAPPISGGGGKGPKGDKGDPGVGISNIELNEDFTLTITLTDGSNYTTESVRGPEGKQGEPGATGQPGPVGERGPKGEDGKDGSPGAAGPKGDKGAGIANVTLEEDYGLKIDLDDGTSFTTASVRGEKGEDGKDGSPGIAGPEGSPGRDGDPGPAGERGNKIYTGTTPPESAENLSDVIKGDIYIRTDTWDVYERSESRWDSKGNIKGEKGDTGSSGSGGGTAEKLERPRLIQTKLDSTEGAYFDGSENIQPGVLGLLPVKNGGTGASSAQDAQIMLGIPQISLGTVDMTPGESTLKTGRFFFCYEP